MACSENMSFYRPEWNSIGSLDYGFGLKRKFRWVFRIANITVGTVEALPCMKAARPKLQMREMNAEHLNETIFYPSKPEWQPIQLSLYDRCLNSQNPIFTWLKQQYDPSGNGGCSRWKPCIDPLSYKTCAFLDLLDGCGEIIESWTLEHVYPQSIEFGELDMSSNEVLTADFTLRYDRAWQTFPGGDHPLYSGTTCAQCQDPQCPSGGGGGHGVAFANVPLEIIEEIEIKPDYVMI